MSYIHGLRLWLRVGVYVAIVASVLHTTVCLESRRSEDERLFAPGCNKDVDIYDFDQQCTTETVDTKPSKWVDPFDMLPSHSTKNAKALVDESVKREKQCEVYMQRFVNLFLRRSGLRHYTLHSGSEKHVNFDFTINSKDLAILQKYGESGNCEQIFAVNDVLTRIFSPAEGTVYSDKPSSFVYNINFPFSQGVSGFASKAFSSIVDSPEVSIPIFVIIVSVSILCVAYITRSYKLAAFTLVYIVFAANFGITWHRMYQEEVSARFYSEMKYSGVPLHCKEQLPFYKHLFYKYWYYVGEDCEEYYKKHFTSPMSQVSLSAVFAESLSVLILYPAQHIAKAYGDFITTATRSVPWYMAIIIFPIVCIVPVLFVFILLALLLNYQISVSPFTGLRIIPHWGQSRCSREEKENKYIEKPADTVQSSKNQLISNPLESAVASNDSSPLFLMNWPAVEKFMHTSSSQKGKEESAAKEHNSKVCKNCQIASTPSDGSGDSSQNMPSSSLKKKPVDCSKENMVYRQIEESKQNVTQCVTCVGDCCESSEASTVLSEDLNSTYEVTDKNENKSGEQEMKAIENQCTVLPLKPCKCQNTNDSLSKDSGSVSEKMQACI